MDTNDLSTAHQLRRRGAELVLPHSRLWYLTVCLMFGLWGSIWDTPMAWRWAPVLAFALAAITALLVLPERRARPLPVRVGWRYWSLVLGIGVAGVTAALGAGLALRALSMPLPFTSSGLLLGVGAVLLARWSRRWRVNHVEQVAQGPW